jgi:ribonuclease HI
MGAWLNMKYYAVINGRETGIFLTWEDCKKQVYKFPNPIYKSFLTREQAEDYIKEYGKDKTTIINLKDTLVAYVDGSFNNKTRVYGYGCVLIYNDEIVEKLSGNGNNKEYASMQNVAGEVLASLKATEYAIKHGYKSLMIYYDYIGIEYWVTGQWKAKKQGTIEYKATMNAYKNFLKINFGKIKAHTGDKYNEMADELAKMGSGVM